MKFLNVYEHEVIRDDVVFFVALLLSIKSFDKKSVDIKQFSFNNERFPYAVLWAFESLYCKKALDNYTIRVPLSGFPEKDFAGNVRPPASYRRSHGFETYNMEPEYIGRLLNRYPEAVDKSYCSFYVDVNHENLINLLKKNAEYFRAVGNIYNSENTYARQVQILVDYIRDKYNSNGNFRQIRIELNSSQLKEVDLIRTIASLSVEPVPKTDSEYEENLIRVFDSRNKRDIWVNGIDDTTIYIYLSDYFVNEYIKKSDNYPLSDSEIDEQVSLKETGNIIEFAGLTLNLKEGILSFNETNLPIEPGINPIKLLEILMSEPDKIHEYKDIQHAFDTTQPMMTNVCAAPYINQGSECPIVVVKALLTRIGANHIVELIETKRRTGLILHSPKD